MGVVRMHLMNLQPDNSGVNKSIDRERSLVGWQIKTFQDRVVI
jgi:hypothetical protein